MERLDVEVEPLDSLFGIDAARLPEPADEFRERSAELRLAWAAAADWQAPINLLRERRRRSSKTVADARGGRGRSGGRTRRQLVAWCEAERGRRWPALAAAGRTAGRRAGAAAGDRAPGA